MRGFIKRTLIYRTFSDREFLRTAGGVAIPVTLQMILTTVTNMVDTVMIGTMGASAISAVGLANKFFFVFALIIFGVHSGTGLLMAQFFGSNDHYHIRKTFGLGLLINLTVAALFALTARLRPDLVMRIFTNSPDSTELGIRYLKYICFTYPLFACSSLMNSMLRSTKQVRIPLISSIVSILTNVFLNWVLIFGHLGAPALGVEGAAIASVACRVAEFLILAYFCFIKGTILPGPVHDFFGWSSAFLNNFKTHSLPVICNEMIWGLGTTLYFVAYGRIGDDAVASISICNTISDMLTTAANGLSSAAAVLLGNELGAGNLRKADDYAKKLLVTGAVVGTVLALLLIPLRPLLLMPFSVSEQIKQDSARCLLLYSAVLPFIFLDLIIIVGILRSGGDTLACFLIDVTGVWLWSVPMAFLGSLVWKLPIYWTYALVLSEELYKAFAALYRCRQRKWLKNLTNEV